MPKLNVLIYSIAALVSVVLGYLPFYGDLTSKVMFIPTMLSATFAAGVAYLILDWRRWLPQSKTVARTGALRGGVVVLLAHFLFGFILTSWAIFETAESVNITLARTISTIQEGISISFVSGIFLPVTLVVGCTTGVVVEKMRNAVDA